MVTMEFQAVIFAGGQGSRMLQLTSSMPKALLPVANRPLVWYPIHMLERAGFQDAIIIVQEGQLVEIRKALEVACDVRLRLEFVCIPGSEDWGTAQSLRHIHHKIKTDVLLISCDLIVDFSLHVLADLHRKYDASLTMLLAPAMDVSEMAVPGGKANRTIERDIIGVDEKGSRVLFTASEADLEEHISFRTSFLKKHPVVNLKTNLLDGHCYLMKKSIVDFLAENRSISGMKGESERIDSIKGDFIPFLVQSQFTTNKSLSSVTSSAKNIQSCVEEDEYTKLAREYSTWNDHSGDMQSCFHGDKIRCYAHVAADSFCMRVNSLVMYCEAGRQVQNHLSALTDSQDISLVHPSVSIPKKSTVGADSMLGQGLQMGEKTLIKHSVIGQHCSIGEKVKVTNSIIMDNVVVEEGCDISGCVICPKVHISKKCELKDCLVCSGQTINEMSNHKNEVITDLDHMMEVA